MVQRTQHFIHNPQAFLENSYMKSCNNQMWAQAIGGMVSNLASMSVFLCQQNKEETVEETTTTTTTSSSEAPKEEPEKAENIIKDLISDYDTLTETTQKALVERYNKLIEKNGTAYDKALIKLNLNNYLKGMNSRAVEQKFGLSEELCSDEIVINGVEEAIEESDTKAYLEAYRTAAQEFIAQYDTDGDGKINLSELKENGIILTDAADRDELAAAFLETINCDADKSTLDVNEVAAYLLSMARINDYNNGTEIAKTGNSINQSEYASTLDVIASNTASVKEYEATLEGKIGTILKKAGISGNEFILLDDLSTLTGISDEERIILQDYKDTNLQNHTKRKIFNGRLNANYSAFSAS